jgi:hypothetical protein
MIVVVITECRQDPAKPNKRWVGSEGLKSREGSSWTRESAREAPQATPSAENAADTAGAA